MRKGIAAAAAAVTLVLTSCSTATTDTKPTSMTSAASSATKVGDLAPGGPVPSPDASQQQALLAALRKVDPALDHERSVGRARNSCRDILDKSPALARNTKFRFEGGAVPTLSEPQVAAIVAAIRSTFCP